MTEARRRLPRVTFKRVVMAVLVVAPVTVLLYSVTRPHVAPMVAPKPPAGTTYGLVVMGDTQQMPVVDWVKSGGADERAAVRAKIAELGPQCVLFAGDAVGAGAYKPAWNNFQREYHGIPMWPVLGNHELHGPDKLGLRYYFKAFPHLEKRRWYALRFPPALYLMLDSNVSDEAQTTWLRAELAMARQDAAIRGICLVAHHPPFSVHRAGGDEFVRSALWGAAAAETKFMASFSGHHHNYQHIRVGTRHAFVTGGGGAPVFLSESSKLPDDATLLMTRQSHHLLHLTVEEAGIRIVMHELQEDGGWKVQDEVLMPWPK